MCRRPQQGVRRFVELALQCSSMQRKERPALEDAVEVLTELWSDMECAPKCGANSDVPQRFICPITQVQ